MLLPCTWGAHSKSTLFCPLFCPLFCSSQIFALFVNPTTLLTVIKLSVCFCLSTKSHISGDIHFIIWLLALSIHYISYIHSIRSFADIPGLSVTCNSGQSTSQLVTNNNSDLLLLLMLLMITGSSSGTGSLSKPNH